MASQTWIWVEKTAVLIHVDTVENRRRLAPVDRRGRQPPNALLASPHGKHARAEQRDDKQYPLDDALPVCRHSHHGTVRLAGVLGRLEQRWCRFEHPRDPRSIGLFRRLVREALPKIAVENGGPNLKQEMGASL